WCRLDRDRPHLDAIRAVDVERAVSADGRSRELTMATPDGEIACGVGYRQTSAVAGPSASRESPCGWARGIVIAAEQAVARDELVRRDYAASTIRGYVQIVEAFRQHTGARLDRITPAQLRRYHLFLLEERRLAVGTVVTQICALRFFCRYVLKRRDVREDLPY